MPWESQPSKQVGRERPPFNNACTAAGQAAVLVKDRAASTDLAMFCKQLRELDSTPDEVSITSLPAHVDCHLQTAHDLGSIATIDT